MKLTTLVAPSVEPITLSDLKTRLRIDHTLDDAHLGRLIVAARLYVEGICGLALITQSLKADYSFSEFMKGVVRLPKAPVASVTSVSILQNGVVTTLDPSSYYLDNTSKPCRLLVQSGSMALAHGETARLSVEFVAGFGATAEDVPSDLSLAVLSLAANWYEAGEGETPDEVIRLLSSWRGARL